MYDFITIERRYGSGGHEIAQKLSSRTGYKLYDKNILIETCKRMDVPYNYLYDMDEKAADKMFFKAPSSRANVKDISLLPLESQIYLQEKEIILEAAETPGAIFVGRCASEILEDKNILKVFITADDEYRIKRAIDVEKIPKDQAQETMKKSDKRREKFFTSHSGVSWASDNYFDLIIDSGRLGIESCVDILEILIQK